eukprot:TRINITY_DN19296_c0_g1_i1.p2 TRINITY_DN19296_c0_g1~~TRINITY_DN19296_c0_g1_i1.p2  ORF type:complete len:102 (-),score=8.84 TRINITY_DN19296_c0_g1_i1:60-365(-)
MVSATSVVGLSLLPSWIRQGLFPPWITGLTVMLLGASPLCTEYVAVIQTNGFNLFVLLPLVQGGCDSAATEWIRPGVARCHRPECDISPRHRFSSLPQGAD